MFQSVRRGLPVWAVTAWFAILCGALIGVAMARADRAMAQGVPAEAASTQAAPAAAGRRETLPAADGAAALTSEKEPGEAGGTPASPQDAAATSASASPVPGEVATEKRAAEAAPLRLVVSSWAGAYGEAQDRAIIGPVGRQLGIEIERRTHGSAGVGRGGGGGVDATELDQSALIAACTSGSVVKIGSLVSQQELAGPGQAPGDDFFAARASGCGVPTFAWSSMMVADGDAMQKLAKRRYQVPGRLQDVLDTKRFPGKRALIRAPERVLEMMLWASGTKGADVYTVLATRRGQDMAFEQLDRLSSAVLWVAGPREALLALDQGEVTMAMTYSGRAFRRLIAGRLVPIWDGHIIDYAAWAVTAASPNQEQAKKFILAATSTASLAAQARIWPYGPMRRSAVALAKRHDLLDRELDTFMPTSEVRFAQGVLFDAAFWAEHGAKLRDRFEAWQAGVPLGIRVPVPTRAPPPPPPVIPPLPVSPGLPQR